jgi:hypothetical protein
MMRAFLKTAILLLVLAASALRAEAIPIARVALSVGEATRVNAAGAVEPLRLGAQLSTGDRIITGKDAIAILVFSDQGRVSLRADSELVIRRYNVDASGADTRLELDLVRGAMRQISGDAARLQPERYRLNTPVAAIGVRGTDFLAKISGNAMETFVHEGMIVVLPRTNGCAEGASTAGCVPLAALSSSDASQYLRVLASGQVERRTVTPDDIERVFGIKLSAAALGGNTAAVSPGVVFVAGAGPDATRTLNGRDELVGPRASAEANRLSTLAAEAAAAMAAERAAQTPPPAAGGPATPVPVPVPVVTLPTQLVWGRFADADNIASQLLQPYAEASQGRHVTVGELGQYALWRNNPSGRFEPGMRGQVQFNLAGAEAWFAQSSGVSAAQVQGASLLVDFDRSQFGAGVSVAHAASGAAASFSVNGRINDEGNFWGGNASQRVAGALSRDGTEAGYLFTKEHALGTFKGVTLWNLK